VANKLINQPTERSRIDRRRRQHKEAMTTRLGFNRELIGAG